MKEKLVLVNGFKIRNTLDDDFGVIHTRDFSLTNYVPKFYIPEGELWVDHRFKDEAVYLKELDDFFAADPALAYPEMKKRVIDRFCAKGDPPPFVRRSEEKEGVTVRYVDGGIVRKYLDPEFIFGGHDLVYPEYIPAGEIWLDDKMDPEELPYVYLHERVERDLMKEGKPYHIAHEYATIADKEAKRKAAIAWYPGDPDYPWRGLMNEKVIHQHYVVQD